MDKKSSIGMISIIVSIVAIVVSIVITNQSSSEIIDEISKSSESIPIIHKSDTFYLPYSIEEGISEKNLRIKEMPFNIKYSSDNDLDIWITDVEIANHVKEYDVGVQRCFFTKMPTIEHIGLAGLDALGDFENPDSIVYLSHYGKKTAFSNENNVTIPISALIIRYSLNYDSLSEMSLNDTFNETLDDFHVGSIVVKLLIMDKKTEKLYEYTADMDVNLLITSWQENQCFKNNDYEIYTSDRVNSKNNAIESIELK
ncbi:hypothetical protein [Nitrosopumilus sp.]|uniref:hypothetical protein n=1 Tax=Nitrosopumilus sp. TaxID=2024843 RepID=UPI00292F371D|nr:hypothetical protein [Nitrosopumilus sp.]